MPFKQYLAELQRVLKSVQATEPSYYSTLNNLLENLDPTMQAVINPKPPEWGSPDLSLKRKKNVLDFPVGWVEAKSLGESLHKAANSRQLKGYRNLGNLVLTDFLEFQWYANGGSEPRAVARLATIDKGKMKPEPGGEDQVRQLLVGFLEHKVPPVQTPKELAGKMALLAHFIRDAILRAHEAEGDKGRLHSKFEAFRETLILDLKPDQFADMYAQTIAYGLFAAGCQAVAGKEQFPRGNAADLIPKTNPFLGKLFQEFSGVGLPEPLRPFVDDLVALLRDADMGAILQNFGKGTAKHDPVVHFYEAFLHEYDPQEKKIRGVYYTPEPVVSYIVRSIDHLLKTRFNKPLGLADKDVLILDPACGTGTFLYTSIRHIYDTQCAKGQKGAWNSYVSENLLKRVFGFELLMAPYAVAHLKLGLLLKDLGYQFDTDERLGIYLTNTLEEAIKRSEALFAQWIADEANAASEIKRDKPIMVVLGNPPYSGHSANKGPGIRKLVEDYKKVDGKPLGEKNPKWLQDDYVKFLRFAQWRIDRTGQGIVGYISNNGYLDNPTFRGMRQSFLRTFDVLSLLNLHGSTKKKETTPEGGKDENVFDIQQGVCIALAVKSPGPGEEVSVSYADLWGSREEKYRTLFETMPLGTDWAPIFPTSPRYLFVPRDDAKLREYDQGWKLPDMFSLNSVAVVTSRDDFVLDYDEDALRKRMRDFAEGELTDTEAREQFKLKEKSHWKISEARQALRVDPNWGKGLDR